MKIIEGCAEVSDKSRYSAQLGRQVIVQTLEHDFKVSQKVR